MFDFCNVNVVYALLVPLIINDCYGYEALRIIDYYWQVESVYEWMNTVYSSDCSFFNAFIENYLIPMNMKIINHARTNTSVEDYFECNDSEPDSVARAHYRCEWYNDRYDCDAYQHYMFEVSKNSRYYNDIKNDSIVDSLLNRKFVHFTMIYNTNTTLNETTDLALILDDENMIADYKSYLTNIGNYSKISMCFNNSIHGMSWKLIATRISMYLGYGTIRNNLNKTQLSQQCNLIYFGWQSYSSCYKLLTLQDITNNNYLESTEFTDANKTVT